MRPLKNKQLLSTFIDQLENPSEITIALPETDSRISDAIDVLKEIDLNIISSSDISRNEKNYLPLLEKLKFSKNWPTEDLTGYSKDPFIKSLPVSLSITTT